MTKEDLKKFLQKHNLKPNFTYGQNFLVDDLVLLNIIDAADLSKNDTVLEIGPGIGNLTELLLANAGFVLAVEKDKKFLPILKSIKKEHENFRYEIADVLEFNFQEALMDQKLSQPLALSPKPYKVVANIPYFITGKILQMLLTAKHKPETIVVLTQKEVAQNIVAGPGNLSLLAISVQLFGQPEIVKIVPAGSFYPAPKVDSAIVKIKLFDKPAIEIANEKKFFGLLRACFSGKRKQIHNTLENNLKLEKGQVQKVLEQTKINPAARPQELNLEQWKELFEKIILI